MNIYLVGGAVRDRMLGIPVKDRDWVVVGATPQAMLDLGYRPVGGDFPVFLHPESKEEYALARTVRNVNGRGEGIVFHADPSVKLEDDLARRDLTINAMAMTVDGDLIDPLNGREDLRLRVFRHASEAFAEDPIRILRVARFSARHPEFSLAPETLALMRDMVAEGAVDALVPERMWKEFSRGLMEPKPSRMFETLHACGALKRIFPEYAALDGVTQPVAHHPEVDAFVHANLVIDQAAQRDFSLPVRFAALCHDLGKGTTPKDVQPKHPGHEIRSAKLTDAVCARWKVPNDVWQTARITAKEHGNVHASLAFDAAATMRLFDRCDAIRRPQRFEEMLQACECDARGRTGLEDREYPQPDRLRKALGFAKALDTKSVAAKLMASKVAGEDIGKAIFLSRTQAITRGFELESINGNPRLMKENTRAFQNAQVRNKIRHVRYLLANNGQPPDEAVLARAALARHGVRDALDSRKATFEHLMKFEQTTASAPRP